MSYLSKENQTFKVDIDGSKMTIKTDSMRSALKHVMAEVMMSDKMPERVEIKREKKDAE